jgi:hypothetical protein
MESVYRSVYNQQRQKYLDAIHKPRMQRVRARHALVFMRDFYFVGHHLDKSLVTSGSIREISTKREKRSLSPSHIIKYSDLQNFSNTIQHSPTQSRAKSITRPRFSISGHETTSGLDSFNSSPEIKLISSAQHSPCKISLPTRSFNSSMNSPISPQKCVKIDATAKPILNTPKHYRNRSIGSLETDIQLPPISKTQHISDLLYSSLQSEAELVSSQIAQDKLRHKKSLESLNKQLRIITLH